MVDTKDQKEFIIQTTSNRMSRRGILLAGAATGLATAVGLFRYFGKS
jgi:hypothetical protein